MKHQSDLGFFDILNYEVLYHKINNAYVDDFVFKSDGVLMRNLHSCSKWISEKCQLLKLMEFPYFSYHHDIEFPFPENILLLAH